MIIESLKIYNNNGGELIPVEFDKLPFVPLRSFWITGVYKDGVGGCHAHHKTQQYIICVAGEVEVDLYDGFTHDTGILKKNEAVFVDKLIWDSQKYLTGKDIILVLCSTLYNRDDYIFDINEFNNIKRYEKGK